MRHCEASELIFLYFLFIAHKVFFSQYLLIKHQSM